PNGDWVVGLFNREENGQVRTIDFKRGLGLDGKVKNVRDLWSHTDLGSLVGGYSVELAPHESKVIRIETNSRKYEAGFASLVRGGERGIVSFDHSALGYVQGFNAIGDKVLWAVEVPKKGNYNLSINYGNSRSQTTNASLNVNGKLLDGPIALPGLGRDNEWSKVQKSVPLNAGINFISIGNRVGNGDDFNLDYIEILE